MELAKLIENNIDNLSRLRTEFKSLPENQTTQPHIILMSSLDAELLRYNFNKLITAHVKKTDKLNFMGIEIKAHDFIEVGTFRIMLKSHYERGIKEMHNPPF
jgi:hypothetical protein